MSVHQWPACHGIAPAAPNAHKARLLGANTSKMPRGRRAAAGSNTSVAMYSATHARVTAFVKFHERNTCRSGPANPHMPGLRRPHTRHTGAEACVSRPHDGHRIDPDVLRNIAVVVGRYSIAFIEPLAEVDQAAGERAERSMRVAVPNGGLAARRARQRALGRSEGGVIRGWHGRRRTRRPSGSNPTRARKACQLGHLALAGGTVFVDTHRR